jgi:hypothetical protein
MKNYQVGKTVVQFLRAFFTNAAGQPGFSLEKAKNQIQ